MWCVLFVSGVRLFFFFFFQAEDGIRDGHVTGVQTCALTISDVVLRRPQTTSVLFVSVRHSFVLTCRTYDSVLASRSEERRVGKSVDLGGRRIIERKKE